MGYTPKVWGRQTWHTIHMVALNYPQQPTEQDKQHYLQFIESFQWVLPCEACSAHFKDLIAQNPPVMDNRESFVKWTIDIHNIGNKYQGKKELTYEEAIDEIKKNGEYPAQSTFKNKKLLLSSAAIIIGVSSAFILYRLVNKKS